MRKKFAVTFIGKFLRYINGFSSELQAIPQSLVSYDSNTQPGGLSRTAAFFLSEVRICELHFIELRNNASITVCTICLSIKNQWDF
jgi:hypothetical protein